MAGLIGRTSWVKWASCTGWTMNGTVWTDIATRLYRQHYSWYGNVKRRRCTAAKMAPNVPGPLLLRTETNDPCAAVPVEVLICLNSLIGSANSMARWLWRINSMIRRKTLSSFVSTFCHELPLSDTTMILVNYTQLETSNTTFRTPSTVTTSSLQVPVEFPSTVCVAVNILFLYLYTSTRTGTTTILTSLLYMLRSGNPGSATRSTHTDSSL